MADPQAESSQIKRKGFNWQFIGIEPTVEPEHDLGSWSVQQVCDWLNSLSLNTLADVSFFKTHLYLFTWQYCEI